MWNGIAEFWKFDELKLWAPGNRLATILGILLLVFSRLWFGVNGEYLIGFHQGTEKGREGGSDSGLGYVTGCVVIRRSHYWSFVLGCIADVTYDDRTWPDIPQAAYRNNYQPTTLPVIVNSMTKACQPVYIHVYQAKSRKKLTHLP